MTWNLAVIEHWNQSSFLSINAGALAPAFLISLAGLLANWSIYFGPVLFAVAWVRRGRVVRFALLDATLTALIGLGVAQVIAAVLNRPGFTGGQNSRRIARYGTDTKEEDREAVFT